MNELPRKPEKFTEEDLHWLREIGATIVDRERLKALILVLLPEPKDPCEK